MKILHVLPSPRAEGTPRLVLDWLSVGGYEQELLFLSPEGELKENFAATGVWQHYNTEFEPRFKSALQIVALVQRICTDRKPDLVIAWPLGFSHWIAWGARKAGVRKNIAHAGNPAGDTFMGKYIHTWISFTVGRLNRNKVIACSDYVMNSFRQIPFVSKKNIFSVYNCTRVDRFMGSDVSGIPRKRDFIMVATLERHKDHATLLKAWKLAEIRTGESVLTIVGDGSLRSPLELMALELQVKRVTFLGSRHDVPDLLFGASYFILSTTHREGFGTVLIEALAAGCKVIATDVPACREVLQNGKYGVLVPAESPERLAQAMIQVFSSTLTPLDIIKQKEYAAGFSPAAMIEKYLSIANC